MSPEISSPHAASHEGGNDALTLTSIDSLACRIKTGTYTGDGTTSKAITGIGFAPKYLSIIPYEEIVTASIWFFQKTDVMYANACLFHYAVTDLKIDLDMIVSIDVDGFTVSDGGADKHPNADGQIYTYLILG